MQYHSGSGDNVNGSKYEIQIFTEVKPRLTLDEILKRKEDYCNNASREYIYLPIIENEKTINIEKIYVSLILTHDNLSREKVSVDTSGVSFGNSIEVVDMQRDLGSPQKMEASDTISLRRILFYKKVAILGEPGIGKSTLLKKLFIDICKDKLFSGFLPIYIPLSNVDIKNNNFISHYITQKYNMLDGVLDYFVNNRQTFFLLDGLDEINYNEQQLVSDVIDLLVAKGNKVFLTCRMAVFPRGLLSSDFKLLECIGFNIAQRRKFLRLWFDDDVNYATLVEKKIANNLGTASISRNPLLLSLIAMHFEDNKYFKLPQKRISIYLKSIELLLVRREKKNILGIPIDINIKLLEYIAYNMNVINVDVIDKELLRKLIIEWRSDNIDSIISQYTVDAIMKLVVEVDGILYQCSKQQMRFLHLTLQESLAASYISRQKNWFELLREKIYVPRWEETLRLLISLVTKDNTHNDIIADYLYNELCMNQGHLFLIGRLLSDFESSNADKFFPIFKILLNYILEDRNRYNYTEAVVALASICNSHTIYQEYLINYFKVQLKNSYKLLYIYIKLLRLMPSQVSRREAVRLIKIFSGGSFKHDAAVNIIGMLLNSLEFYYEPNFWKDIFQKYVNRLNSHLSGIIAVSISNIQMIEMHDFLEEESRMADQYKNIIISYIIQKYEDEEFTKNFFISAIKKHDIYLEQTFSDQYLVIDNNEILDLIKKEKDEINLAVLLNSGFSFKKREYNKFLETIIFNDNTAMVLKCSALNTYLSENSNNKENISKIVTLLKENRGNINLQLICVSNLAKQENSLLAEYFFECGSDLDYRVICSLTRVLGTVLIEGAVFWLQEILGKFKVGNTIHMYAVLALANYGYPDILAYLDEYIIKLPKIHIRGKVLIIKALSKSKISNRIGLLYRLLKCETDIDIISLIIETMGFIKEKKSEEILLQYLDVDQWPSNWPPLYSELERGEQRPTDRRMIMIILSLNKLGSRKAIPSLEKICNDVTQSDDVRRTAYIAYNNLKFNQCATPSVETHLPSG